MDSTRISQLVAKRIAKLDVMLDKLELDNTDIVKIRRYTEEGRCLQLVQTNIYQMRKDGSFTDKSIVDCALVTLRDFEIKIPGIKIPPDISFDG